MRSSAILIRGISFHLALGLLFQHRIGAAQDVVGACDLHHLAEHVIEDRGAATDRMPNVLPSSK